MFGTGVGGLGAQQAANDACELPFLQQYLNVWWTKATNWYSIAIFPVANLLSSSSVSRTPLSNGSCHKDACGIWR